MHDRAFADEDRPKCILCKGEGWLLNNGNPAINRDQLEDHEYDKCPECHGTGYEPRPDGSEDF